MDRPTEERPGSETDSILQVASALIPTPTRPLARNHSAAQRQAVDSSAVAALPGPAPLEASGQPTTPPQLSEATTPTLEAASLARTRRLALARHRLAVADCLEAAAPLAALERPTPPRQVDLAPILVVLSVQALTLPPTMVPPTLLSSLSPRKMERPAMHSIRPSRSSSHTKTTLSKSYE